MSGATNPLDVKAAVPSSADRVATDTAAAAAAETGTTMYIPTEPVVGPIKRTATENCGFERRTMLGEGYLKFLCAPADPTGTIPDLRNVDRCEIVKVQKMHAGLVQRSCEKSTVETRVGLSVTNTGDKTVITPLVREFGVETTNPASASDVEYSFNPFIGEDPQTGGKFVYVQVPAHTGGANNMQEVTCGFPTHMTQDGHYTPCQNPGGPTGRCAAHPEVEISGGGSSRSTHASDNGQLYQIVDPNLGGGAQYVAVPTTDSNGKSATVVTLMTPEMLAQLQESKRTAGDVGSSPTDRFDANLREGANLSQSELTSLFGVGTADSHLKQLTPKQKAALEALKKSQVDRDKGKMVWYVYNTTFGEEPKSIDRDNGFNFADRYLHFPFRRSMTSEDKTRARTQNEYWLKLTGLINFLNLKHAKYSSKSVNIQLDTIATLEAHIIAVVATLELTPVDFARLSRLGVAGVEDGLFDGLEAFKDVKDSHGQNLMHPIIAYYAFTPPMAVWRPPNLRRYWRPVGETEANYIDALAGLFRLLSEQEMPPKQTSTNAGIPVTVQSGKTLDQLREEDSTIANLGNMNAIAQEFTKISSTVDNRRFGVYEAHIMSMLCFAQRRYGYMFNFATVEVDFSKFDIGYILPELQEYRNTFRYPANVTATWVRAHQFAIKNARAMGQMLPEPKKFGVNDSKSAATSEELLRALRSRPNGLVLSEPSEDNTVTRRSITVAEPKSDGEIGKVDLDGDINGPWGRRHQRNSVTHEFNGGTETNTARKGKKNVKTTKKVATKTGGQSSGTAKTKSGLTYNVPDVAGSTPKTKAKTADIKAKAKSKTKTAGAKAKVKAKGKGKKAKVPRQGGCACAEGGGEGGEEEEDLLEDEDEVADEEQ